MMQIEAIGCPTPRTLNAKDEEALLDGGRGETRNSNISTMLVKINEPTIPSQSRLSHPPRWAKQEAARWLTGE